MEINTEDLKSQTVFIEDKGHTYLVRTVEENVKVEDDDGIQQDDDLLIHCVFQLVEEDKLYALIEEEKEELVLYEVIEEDEGVVSLMDVTEEEHEQLSKVLEIAAQVTED